MPRRSCLGFVLCLTAVGGCDFHEDVGRYRALLDGEHPRAVDPYQPAAPLSLARALRVANADNEAIGLSGENYIQGLATKMRAAGTFLPTLSLSPTYSLSKGGSSGSGFVIGGTTSNTGGTTGGGTTGTTTGGTTTTGGQTIQITGGNSGVNHSFSVPIGASVNGSLANVSTYQASGTTADQLAQTVLDERETILLQTVQSYYEAIRFERQVGVYERSLNFRAEKVRDQQARLKLGAVRPLDVAQSEADLATTRVNLTQARASAANARSALARLMGVSAVDGPLTDAFDPPADVPPVGLWQADAARQRQDLAAAELAVVANQYKVEAAIREYYPSVSINFNYFLYNDPNNSNGWSGGLSGSIPIFSALQIEADVRAAWSQFRAAGLTRSQTRRAIADDVNQQFQNLANAREQVDELRVAVASAQTAVDLAERGYQLGSTTNLNRLTQQDALLTAELNLVTQELARKSSYLALLRASGGLNAVVR